MFGKLPARNSVILWVACAAIGWAILVTGVYALLRFDSHLMGRTPAPAGTILPAPGKNSSKARLSAIPDRSDADIVKNEIENAITASAPENATPGK